MYVTRWTLLSPWDSTSFPQFSGLIEFCLGTNKPHFSSPIPCDVTCAWYRTLSRCHETLTCCKNEVAYDISWTFAVLPDLPVEPWMPIICLHSISRSRFISELLYISVSERFEWEWDPFSIASTSMAVDKSWRGRTWMHLMSQMWQYVRCSLDSERIHMIESCNSPPHPPLTQLNRQGTSGWACPTYISLYTPCYLLYRPHPPPLFLPKCDYFD